MAEMNFVTKLVSIIEMVELADVANALSSILYLQCSLAYNMPHIIYNLYMPHMTLLGDATLFLRFTSWILIPILKLKTMLTPQLANFSWANNLIVSTAEYNGVANRQKYVRSQVKIPILNDVKVTFLKKELAHESHHSEVLSEIKMKHSVSRIGEISFPMFQKPKQL